VPVFGRIFDSPDIAGFVQHQSQDPELLIWSELDAVHHLRSDPVVCRKSFQADGFSNFEGTTKSHGATLRIYQESHSRFRKVLTFSNTADSERDSAIDSGAAPSVWQKSLLRTIWFSLPIVGS
jgi:hypothetical protein